MVHIFKYQTIVATFLNKIVNLWRDVKFIQTLGYFALHHNESTGYSAEHSFTGEEGIMPESLGSRFVDDAVSASGYFCLNIIVVVKLREL